MRILFYHTVQKGGVISYGVHITEVLKYLSGMGHTIIYADGKHYKTTEPLKSAFVSETSQPKSCWVRAKEYVKTSPFRGEALVLYSFLKESRLFFFALRTMLRCKPDLIYRRHGILGSEHILSRIFKVPAIREVNGIVTDEARISKKGNGLSLRIIDNLERHNLRQADKYIVVTSKLKDVLCNDYKVSEDKIVVIQNGANTDLFHPINTSEARRILNLSEEYNYVCFVGGLYYWQGLHNLIKSAPLVLEQYPDTRFLIIGDGPMKAELIEQARQAGISDNVVFTGAVSYEKIPLYINAGDVCVVPKIPLKSGYSPLKLYEYMACGRPVIATRTDGFEVLEEKNAGLLVNPENSQQFANAIVQLLADKELGSRMGENGRTYVVGNHSWEIVARRVADVCESVVGGRKSK